MSLESENVQMYMELLGKGLGGWVGEETELIPSVCITRKRDLLWGVTMHACKEVLRPKYEVEQQLSVRHILCVRNY